MDVMTIVIAAVLVLGLAGLLIGLFYALRGGKYNSTSQKPTAEPSDLVEIARLERDSETNILMVLVDGKLYANESDLSFNQRQKLISAAKDLQKWLGLSMTSVFSSQPKADSIAPSAVSPIPPTMMTDVLSDQIKPIPANPVESLRHSIRPSNATLSYMSIPAQINEILQGKIAGTSFEQRGLQLVESPTAGVVVHVDMKQYPGIDDVPDEEVISIIRSAVAEWEKRHR